MQKVLSYLLALAVVVESLPTPAPVPSPFKRSAWVVVGAFTDNACSETALVTATGLSLGMCVPTMYDAGFIVGEYSMLLNDMGSGTTPQQPPITAPYSVSSLNGNQVVTTQYADANCARAS